MFLSIIFIPIISAFVCGFLGWWLGCYSTKYLSSILIGFTCFLSWNAFYTVGLLKNTYYIVLGSWINSGLFYVNWSFLFDSLSVTMLIVVTSVSSLVHLYSSSYMSEDPHLSRFMSYLSLFTFFMIILINILMSQANVVTYFFLVQNFLYWFILVYVFGLLHCYLKFFNSIKFFFFKEFLSMVYFRSTHNKKKIWNKRL